jgi:2-polyprenyl-6-hydroxyphenyl methylase/3-demethylubiquinone-9 3-methyltransferase
MSSYYSENLSGRRLQRCYELATPRVRRYLRAEIDHVRSRLSPDDDLLELGCGYGRVLFELAGHARQLVGIDTAPQSLDLAKRSTPPGLLACRFIDMDAVAMTFRDDQFDVVICLQNGIAAFGVDREVLVREAVRVCRPGGRVMFSSYAPGFWRHRLEWFELQAAHGLLGAIDRENTRDGVIVCKDGFRAGCLDEEDFRELWHRLGFVPEFSEVDGSALFCETVVG